MKQRYIVDGHKLLTSFFILGLMAAYGRWDNPTAWLYLALHGTYGMIWLIKSALFPDKRWQQRVSAPYAVGLAATLTLYWAAPWLLIARDVRAAPPLMALCVAVYTLGIFLHYTSDMQKHMALAQRPGTLVSGGLWGVVRNPNYLGELLIYLGFGMLAQHWLPIAIIAAVVAAVWWPNMRQKDRSLARYPEFAVYQRSTKLLIPFIW
ncbi:DUF1295 domain-containing protein [Chloroflexia bacterium SDU3-3]|nr:DUF1295 domain-containing protein [Chloroflexia bacterium SDU3-3]